MDAVAAQFNRAVSCTFTGQWWLINIWLYSIGFTNNLLGGWLYVPAGDLWRESRRWRHHHGTRTAGFFRNKHRQCQCDMRRVGSHPAHIGCPAHVENRKCQPKWRKNREMEITNRDRGRQQSRRVIRMTWRHHSAAKSGSGGLLFRDKRLFS
jgi:hypothetical protein